MAPAKAQGAHYDVYLKTKRGTVRKRICVPRRDVGLAKMRAVADIQRVLREPVTVIDCVPLKVIASKRAPTIDSKRRKRPVTTTVVEFKRTRRPKARESVRITPKGKLAPLSFERELVTDAKRKPPKGPVKGSPCANPNCIKRGSCLSEWQVHTNRVHSGGGMIIRVHATTEREARLRARDKVRQMNLIGVRFTKIKAMTDE